MKTFAICLTVLLVSACGSSNNTTSSSDTSLSYDLKENGCDTGNQTFSNLTDYCAGLKNYALNNNGCAYQLRSDLYATKCTAYGAFIETNIPPTASMTSFSDTSN